MQRVAGRPDLHPGRGYPVGAAFFTTNKVYPALVGNDISCGMSFWQTSAKVSKVNLDKMAKKFEYVELSLDGSWAEIEEVYDQAAIDVLGLNKKQLQLLVHSGSRGFGQSILVNHVTTHNHDGIEGPVRQLVSSR